MATIKVRRTALGVRYAVIDARGHTVKTHRHYESAAWHVFILNSYPSRAAATRAANDADWANRC